jgi:O-antigen ligase
MSRNHIGFALFMLLLLIAPKIPSGISGGVERSSISLGIVGLVLWYIACPGKFFCFPMLNFSHPLFWLIIFAIYAFVVSFLSYRVISMAYSVQYLFYAVLGTLLLKRYLSNNACIERHYTQRILFLIAIVYSAGILASIFTGPIYPHQAIAIYGRWGGLAVQKGVGFAENQNMAGPVVIFFTAAGIYLYRNNTWKKWILLCLLFSALLATLSRGAIFSFIGAMVLMYCFDSTKPLFRKASIKVSILKNMSLVLSALSFLFILIFTGIYLVNKPIFIAILTGFGLNVDGQHGVVARDFVSRSEIWAWGIDYWMSQDLLKMIFGGGFRNSMAIDTVRGTWKDAHNMYITILGDFGIVGLALFLITLFRGFFRYVRLFLTNRAKDTDRFGLLVLLSLTIDNMTGPYFYSPVCLSLLIFTFAIKDSFLPKAISISLAEKDKSCYQS